MKITFAKPYKFEGTEFKELDIPVEKMTGKDFADTKKAWVKEGNFAAVPAADSEFCIRIAAKLAKQPIEFFETMPVNEYVKISTAVSNFLLS